MDIPTTNFRRAGSLEELKAKGRFVLHGAHRPILVVYDSGRVVAFDNRCPHMGFPLDRGSVEDGILTCHWHHARFDLASGCTFDLWADDVPTCPVEVRGLDVWVKPIFGYADPLARGADGSTTALPQPWPCHRQGGARQTRGRRALGGCLGRSRAVRRAHRRSDGWGVGLTILTALGNLLPMRRRGPISPCSMAHAGWRPTARDGAPRRSVLRSQAGRISRP
jgi:nitrite reductase/ring-hydroxylating ferredoxin subunit